MNKESFSGRLSRLMSERKLTVRALGAKTNVSASTLQDWRSGASPTDFEAVKVLADALGVSFEFLLLGKESQSRKGEMTVTECFRDGGSLFDGYAKITIQRLIPRSEGETDD